MGTKPTLTSAQAVAGNNVIDISYPVDPKVRGPLVIQMVRDAAERSKRLDLVQKIDNAEDHNDKFLVVADELKTPAGLHGEWRSLVMATLRVLPIEGEDADDGPYWASFIQNLKAVAP